MSHSVSNLALLAVITSLVHAQNVNSSAPTFTFPSGYTTSTFNNSAQPTPYTRTDFSPNALASLWDLVGPVATGPVTSTVFPTPEPTAYAQPDAEFYHPLVSSSYSEVKDLKLPAGFKWGLSSSAYQIEGAAKDEGKGPSIWDLLSHRGHFVSDNSTGDVVASQYWLYKQDFARLKGLGIPAFGVSISWPRFFPFGHGPVNQEAVQHYDDVIAEMHAHGIKPAVSIFHWDTPLALFAEYGAWTDRRIVDHFFNYAKFVISRYDEYVDEWFTINEPQYCNWQYSLYPAGQYYPAPNNITGGDSARFLCGHHTLLAHAQVAKWYHNEFQGRHRITFKNSGNYYEARDALSDADQVARQRNFDFSLGWFGGPWTDGDYPASLKDTLGDLLPSFTQAEKDLIKGSCDFFAIDPYSSYLAHELPGGLDACVSNRSHPSFPECAGSVSLTSDSFPIGPAADPAMSWLYSAPAGVRRFLKHITTELFPSVPDIVVAEFGFAEPFEARWQSVAPALWDLRRADYLQSYLDNILLAIHVDGVNVTGAWGWAIFDNFEWALGTSVRFGLQYVNYTSLDRTPKASMFQFLNWFKEHEHEGNRTMRLV